MSELMKQTITTLEVAEMMEIPHNDILRKLDGRKDRKGYVQILSESQMAVAEYFIKSSYTDAQGKERPCYEVTRMGCDFLANKSTGEKGVIFTARYVRRFAEMEQAARQVALTEHPGEVANLLKSIGGVAKDEGLAPHKIAENARLICEQYGIRLIPDFVKVPEHSQMELAEYLSKE